MIPALLIRRCNGRSTWRAANASIVDGTARSISSIVTFASSPIARLAFARSRAGTITCTPAAASTRGLDADAGVATGDDCGLAVEAAVADHLARGGVGAETGRNG